MAVVKQFVVIGSQFDYYFYSHIHAGVLFHFLNVQKMKSLTKTQMHVDVCMFCYSKHGMFTVLYILISNRQQYSPFLICQWDQGEKVKLC